MYIYLLRNINLYVDYFYANLRKESLNFLLLEVE